MCFVVLIFGFAAVLLTAGLGLGFILFNEFVKALRDSDFKGLADQLDQTPMGIEHGTVGVFLAIAAGLGLLGTLLGFMRCGWQGGLLMLIPVLGAALMNPLTLIFTGLQALVALMSFFVFPLPLAPQED